MALSATSQFFLNTSRDDDPTTSLGTRFQCFITLSLKIFLQTSNHKIWNKSHPCPKLVSSCWRPFHFIIKLIIFNLNFYSASHYLNLASGNEVLPWSAEGREELGQSWGHPAGNLDILFLSHWPHWDREHFNFIKSRLQISQMHPPLLLCIPD